MFVWVVLGGFAIGFVCELLRQELCTPQSSIRLRQLISVIWVLAYVAVVAFGLFALWGDSSSPAFRVPIARGSSSLQCSHNNVVLFTYITATTYLLGLVLFFYILLHLLRPAAPLPAPQDDVPVRFPKPRLSLGRQPAQVIAVQEPGDEVMTLPGQVA